MKTKSFNKKLKLQKENIVNLNQLNMIKGGIPTVGISPTNDCNTVTRVASEDVVLDLDVIY